MQLTMIHKTIRAVFTATALLGVLTLSGCGGTDQDITLQSVDATEEQQAQTAGSVIMDFANGDIPFPHDALFSGSTDGTLNIPVADANNYADPKVAMNAVDGFSTSAPITFKVSKSLNLADANNNSVADILESGLAIYRTVAAADTKAVGAISARLIPGVDYLPVISDALGDAKNVAIIPLKPLAAKTTYLITLNHHVVDAGGTPLGKSLIYRALSGSNSLIGSSLEALEPLRQLTNAHLTALVDASVDTTNLIASWSFSTQSTADVLQTLTTPKNTSLVLADTTLSTTDFGGQGAAQIYAGSLDVPYYGGVLSQENPLAPLNTFWRGVQGSMLSQFNPTPVAASTQTIPVLMSVPEDSASKPATGWPVVIFQHGVTQNRANLLAVADSLAAAGFAAIAIDMPLHGIPANSALSALRNANVPERTFDVDYVTENAAGAITAAQPDGVQDSSGRHFINLSHLVVTRDNMRQAVVDLMQLRASLAEPLGIAADLLDADKVSFASHSLGAMVGAIYQSFEPLNAAVYAMPGLQAAYLLANSANFRSEIEAGLAAQGVLVGSPAYQQFLLAAQTVLDSADPLNYLADLDNPSLVIEVVGDGFDHLADQTIPNSVATAPLAGTEPWARLQALNTLTGSGLVSDGLGIMRFNAGDHSSILSAASNLTATVTMQEAMASFLATGGSAVQVSDTTTVKQAD